MDRKFGGFVREKRMSRGLKLKAFAEMVGISPVYESYIESGKRPAPTKRVLDSMASVLGLSPAEEHELHRLAYATHSKYDLPDDLGEYIMERPYITETISVAKEHDTPKEEWAEFRDRISKL